ncbi:MAG: glycosyltransferase family 2 protein [Chitinophagaceae bacterium]|nr:glycosyltransferase family 2 protein [Chitinophagaceae bacterium]
MTENIQSPWVSFCISTFKRPDFLHQQLSSLLKQTFTNFEIVISDNDPEGSAGDVCLSFKDNRIRYFHNQENLGMIKSFNKSIERARTDFIVMVTDDDPVENDFLSVAHSLWVTKPGYGIYGGFQRKHKRPSEIEIIQKENFIAEILDWQKTPGILWSSCVLKKKAATIIGNIPDYGSPHLADHAFIALIGDRTGGVIINKMYSSLTSHNTNFSKLNFQTYITGCTEFYKTMKLNIQEGDQDSKWKAINQHLGDWLLAIIYNLKRYYSVNLPDKKRIQEIDTLAKEMVRLPFMKRNKTRLKIKELIFRVKLFLGILKPTH